MAESLKRRLLAGGFWVLAGKLVTASTNLGASALLARLLTQDGFGAYTLIFSLVTGGALVSQLGLHQAVVRSVAESMGRDDPARARAAVVFSYRYVAVGIFGVTAFLLLGGGEWIARDLWTSPALVAAIPAAAIWLAMVSLQVLTSETFRGFKDLKLASLFGGVIAGSVTFVVLGVWFVWRHTASVEQAAWITATATALSLAFGITAVRSRLNRMPPGGSVVAREVFAISLPLWTTSVTAYLLSQAPLWILGVFRPESEIALYGGALRLVTLVSMPLILVNLVVPPFITELYDRGERVRLERVLRSAATFAGVPAFVVLISFVVFGSSIMGSVYGPDYRLGAPILALLSLGYLINVWTGSCGLTLIMTGFQNTLMGITVVTAILSVVGSYFVVEPFGAQGIAAVVCGTSIAHNLAMWIATRYHTGMWTHATLPNMKDIRALLAR